MIDFKLPKKLIVFSMTLILVSGCADISISTLPIPSTGTPLARQDGAQDKPLLTWEAVKELTAGSLSYSEIRNSFYFQDIGSGLYVISFPIKEGPEFSLSASSTGRAPQEILRDYHTMLLRDGWEPADTLGLKQFYKKTIDGNELLISVAYIPENGSQDTENLTVIRFNIEPLPTAPNRLIHDEQDVQELVEAFGKRIQAVSITAPPSTAAAGITEHYSDYVTPELLQQWQTAPQTAPGRLVSSPWPDRIDILATEMYKPDQCTVRGEIIEVTSVEMAQGGAAAKRPVEIALRQIKGRWFISGVRMGEYIQTGPVVYENTRYGFAFHLPETWKGYSIIAEQWQGTQNDETTETGPLLLIRHPEWTRELPRQDIPLMVFTPEQWQALREEGLSVGAAPIGPRKLGGNSRYIFAIPARYNYAFPAGYEEVEDILQSSPLWPLRQSAFPQ
ncbi:hypothetical protein Dhaf_2095 [Desulfitobacterium hafniense DCB-2]|uniref:Prokaryotic membrane lipoprotein lipid attachment site profile n=1 Tax=Desulfitobacterium hafniense (strain DSM 10664 / DCB-2) TaxID=272564 RepID=B8FRZ3_DESHD|nr:hypothetical protein [Desulfitobacterium hafniense]ACL20131.1 hypothetical protein Dhaf_2095 [Desulfitobacterium hafniense DCB-2]